MSTSLVKQVIWSDQSLSRYCLPAVEACVALSHLKVTSLNGLGSQVSGGVVPMRSGHGQPLVSGAAQCEATGWGLQQVVGHGTGRKHYVGAR